MCDDDGESLVLKLQLVFPSSPIPSKLSFSLVSKVRRTVAITRGSTTHHFFLSLHMQILDLTKAFLFLVNPKVQSLCYNLKEFKVDLIIFFLT